MIMVPFGALLGTPKSSAPLSLSQVMNGYKSLLFTRRGLRTYGYVLVNGTFHSGVFTWLGLYFNSGRARGMPRALPRCIGGSHALSAPEDLAVCVAMKSINDGGRQS